MCLGYIYNFTYNMSKTFKTGWYTIYVKSCQEKKVYHRLLEKGYDAFLPRVKTVRQWSDRKKTIEIPLFSSYVFANIKTWDDFHKVLEVKGTCGYIRFGNEYSRVREQEIVRIKLLIGVEEISNVKVAEYKLKVGEHREVKYGPLAGLECEILEATNNQNKVSIRMDSMQKNITAILPSYYFYEKFDVA